jgi:group I intron endonuclease
MIHYVYETRNKLDNKIYVGVRSSKHFDDAYFGSGKHLKRAICKYGIENFNKRILWVFGKAEEAYQKESEIVDQSFVKRRDTYNIATGGKGGNLGDAINKRKSEVMMGHSVSEDTKRKISEANKGNTSRKGAKWSEESKKKLSDSCKGREAPNKGVPHSEKTRANMRKPHKSTGPKLRLSCIKCNKETTVNSFWRHKECKTQYSVGLNA